MASLPNFLQHSPLAHLSQFLDKGTGSWIVRYLWVVFPFDSLHAHTSLFVDDADRLSSRNYYDLPTIAKGQASYSYSTYHLPLRGMGL